MKQALSGMKDVGFLESKICLQVREEIFEIPEIRFVRTNIFCGVNGIEFHLELLVAACEALPIDIRQNDQLVVLFQILKRARRVGKGRPTGNRSTESCAFLLGDLDVPLPGDIGMDEGEKLRIPHRGCLGLLG